MSDYPFWNSLNILIFFYQKLPLDYLWHTLYAKDIESLIKCKMSPASCNDYWKRINLGISKQCEWDIDFWTVFPPLTIWQICEQQ